MTSDSTHTRPSPVVRADRAISGLREVAEGGTYAEPPELYAVLVRLTQVVTATGQALDGAAGWLRAEDRAGRVGADEDDAEAIITATLEALAAAAAQAGQLAALIDEAAGNAGHLTRTD